jgi:hypothetical protein
MAINLKFKLRNYSSVGRNQLTGIQECIAVRLTDLLSNKQRSDNLTTIRSEHGML